MSLLIPVLRQMSNFRCAVCGRGINGRFYTTEHNQKYCGSHIDPPRCRYCLHLLSNGQSEPCPKCVASGFSALSMAQPSIARVASWMERHVGAHSLLNVPIKLTDAVHFSPNQSGLTNWRYDGMNLDVEIEMLKFAQSHIFEPTLAHEYGHVILVADPLDLSFTGGIGQARLQEEEGFCEVLRYLWVLDNKHGSNDLELKAITDNDDPLYGDGFRLMWPQFKAAGSIMNLRADMLEISRSGQPKSSGWLFGKKKQPVVPPSATPPVPVISPTQQQPAEPNNASPPVVIEGGSHRPMIDLGLDRATPKTVHPKPSPTADPQRPTIDFTPASGNQNTPPSPAQSLHEGDENRPIIRFD